MVMRSHPLLEYEYPQMVFSPEQGIQYLPGPDMSLRIEATKPDAPPHDYFSHKIEHLLAVQHASHHPPHTVQHQPVLLNEVKSYGTSWERNRHRVPGDVGKQPVVSKSFLDRLVVKNLANNLSGFVQIDENPDVKKINIGRGRMSKTADRLKWAAGSLELANREKNFITSEANVYDVVSQMSEAMTAQRELDQELAEEIRKVRQMIPVTTSYTAKCRDGRECVSNSRDLVRNFERMFEKIS